MFRVSKGRMVAGAVARSLIPIFHTTPSPARGRDVASASRRCGKAAYPHPKRTGNILKKRGILAAFHLRNLAIQCRFAYIETNVFRKSGLTLLGR
jgi:hypothetical protein